MHRSAVGRWIESNGVGNEYISFSNKIFNTQYTYTHVCEVLKSVAHIYKFKIIVIMKPNGSWM